MLLSEQEQQSLARVATQRQRMQEGCDRANGELDRLRDATDEELHAILGDPSSPSRHEALVALIHRRPPALAELLLPLFADPDEQVARLAIQCSPPADPAVNARLHELLDHAERWSWPVTTLARTNDSGVISLLAGWFLHGDRDHRMVAYGNLFTLGLLGVEARLALLREAWAAGARDDEDRVVLAIGLLDHGDRTGWAFLIDHCLAAAEHSACWAAETIRKHDSALGLKLMGHILDHGSSFDVRWGMAEKIARGNDLHHLWTADGLTEARFWVDQQVEALNRGT